MCLEIKKKLLILSLSRNFKLLSFGDEAEEEEEEVLAATKNFSTKGNSAHDIAMDPTLSASTGKTLNNGNEALDRWDAEECCFKGEDSVNVRTYSSWYRKWLKDEGLQESCKCNIILCFFLLIRCCYDVTLVYEEELIFQLKPWQMYI